MSKNLQSVTENPLSRLLTLEIFMENFDEIILRAEDVLLVEMKGVKEAFPGLTPPSLFKEFFKAYDGSKITIKAEVNHKDRFKPPIYHEGTPFERLSAYGDIVALTFRYDVELDIREIIQYAEDKKSITVYVPYQEAKWDRYQSVLQSTTKNDDGSLTIEFAKATGQ